VRFASTLASWFFTMVIQGKGSLIPCYCRDRDRCFSCPASLLFLRDIQVGVRGLLVWRLHVVHQKTMLPTSLAPLGEFPGSTIDSTLTVAAGSRSPRTRPFFDVAPADDRPLKLKRHVGFDGVDALK
jgi:hypothetical protein